ncbi:MAG: hypothetical protein A3F82_08285 [Deltaproteobacteria bacterium RIFCSPLOWO2_12_FULL_44_12]|nr:MAG: hypothetical protein A2712_06990 [Deltaproteobacteria bacterium RIFCSPHIGHO2_01_FULL_43_49]OGQ15693.1 MAG: hypothetical protein A3D22_05780 [Deltaproteobacteria bacterium RIFCSPHIGHO2_02_FULL_44_53]OGQ28662.1 MAG: hypothetical protein A3D98_00515 [Deltaproteobacteria bacterium RIFCSPHIGHO2_12_FULL_44_21]OGQ31984.1 MAG: hypothetical protein A2979_02720 [Deltaproteobacteria bacterium RIFCSPLOWO2_01_FULL_45_74]OGQ43598.1 MAG: hypothetical protein A3I70_03240 [Deltaproteobacteria bacterium 
MKKISRPYLYLGVTLLAAVFVLLLEKPTADKKGDVVDIPLLGNLDVQTIAMIEIEYLLNGVRLKKGDGGWMVSGFKTKIQENIEKADVKKETEAPEKWYKADSNKVDLILNILLDVQLSSLAGNNPEKHGFFEVNAVGMQIRLFDSVGKKIEHLYLGKTGAGFLESYVRKEGENEVYLANRYLRGTLSPTAEDWKEKPKK